MCLWLLLRQDKSHTRTLQGSNSRVGPSKGSEGSSITARWTSQYGVRYVDFNHAPISLPHPRVFALPIAQVISCCQHDMNTTKCTCWCDLIDLDYVCVNLNECIYTGCAIKLCCSSGSSSKEGLQHPTCACRICSRNNAEQTRLLERRSIFLRRYMNERRRFSRPKPAEQARNTVVHRATVLR